uniref:NADH dehydrogenase subunit 6 n=1 Tax=Heterosiphonia pulchra TaxID=189631 RepID=UPI002E79F9CA|nr:NADH dehydrogenase subunit 6 [Heterosiphonia pulchra]WQF69558.1 NADH dehydrogenase subunit 6 [Heterosiphonia pulchra]
MTIEVFLFYLFFILSFFSSFMVITLKNAIYSVLFLILTFCNITLLLLILGAEFFSFLLLIVYVGAIAILFLFVIMMLNIKIEKTKTNYLVLSPIFIFITILLGDNLYNFSINFDLLKELNNQIFFITWLEESNIIENIKVIGYILYTKYCLLFLIASLILLVSMIGVITLTMYSKLNVKKQKIEFQLLKNQKKTLKFIKIRN